IVATNVHPDFGWAMVPQTNPGGTNVYLNGVPAAGFTTTAAATFEGINIASGTVLTAFDVTAASVGCPAGNPTCSSPWEAQDQDAPITADPNIGLKSSADAGFFYQSFNFERLPFGYINPAQGSNAPNNDVGKPLRLAVAHATDKRTIVTSLLQNFGVAGHTVVSPTNTLYYNSSAPRYEFDSSVAASILDAAAADSFYGAQGYGVDPPGACLPDGTGCRSLPGIG